MENGFTNLSDEGVTLNVSRESNWNDSKNDSITAEVGIGSYPMPEEDIMNKYLRQGFELDRITRIVAPIIFSILFLGGLVANGLVIYVTVVTNRTSKHPIHSIFVLNLAISDIIFLVVSAPYSITNMTTSTWIFGAFLCSFIPFLSTTTVCASIYTICALAWIRFMALVMPFRFRRSCISTRKAGYFVLLGIWLAGIILSVPDLFYRRIEYNNKTQVGPCVWLGPVHANNVYAIVKLTSNYFFPLLLVTFFYVVVGREVLCYMMHRNSLLNRGRSQEQKECFKSTIVVLSLILSFLVCWFPHCLYTTFYLTGYISEYLSGPENGTLVFFLKFLAKCMSYAHAIVNPFIYTFASPTFRRSLKSSFREKLHSCRDGKSFCARRNASSASRVNRRVRQESVPVALREHPCENAEELTPMTNGITEAITPKTYHAHVLAGGDSHFMTHVTEVTRIATPELSHGRRIALSTSPHALEKSDVEENGTAKSRKGENGHRTVQKFENRTRP